MFNQKKQKNTFVFFLVLLSLVVGSFWVFNSWSGSMGADGADYYKISENICRFHRFDVTHDGQRMQTMSRAPLYPFLISIPYCLIGDNPNIIRLFQIFLLVGIVILVYLISKLIFNERVARIASLLTTFFPPIGILTGFINTELTFIFLLLIGTLFLVLFFKTEKNKYAFWTGIFLGLTTLTRPIPLLLPLFLIFSILIYQKFKLTKLLKKSLILLIAFTLIITPWLSRNYIIFDQANISDVSGLAFYNRAYRIHFYSSEETKHYILLSLFGSYLSKKIDSNYSYSFSKFEPHFYRRSSDFPIEFGPKWPSGLTLNESRNKLLEEAKPLIFQHPVKFLGFSFLEFFRIHRPLLTEYGDTDLFAGTHPEIPDFKKTSILIFIKLTYLLFFIMVFYGIIISFRKNKLTLPVLIIVLYTILLLCSLGVIPRYVIPLYPFYFIFFSFSIINLFNNFFQK